jgi:hypothetical protein
MNDHELDEHIESLHTSAVPRLCEKPAVHSPFKQTYSARRCTTELGRTAPFLRTSGFLARA